MSLKCGSAHSDMVTIPSEELPAVFVTHAAEVLGDTSKGLSGNQIVKETAAYALDWNVVIPYLETVG